MMNKPLWGGQAWSWCGAELLCGAELMWGRVEEEEVSDFGE